MASTFTVNPSDAGDKGVPCGLLLALTFSDALDYPSAIERMYVGVVGDVTVKDNGGNQVKFETVPAGTTLNFPCRRVMATGTAATDIVAFTNR